MGNLRTYEVWNRQVVSHGKILAEMNFDIWDIHLRSKSRARLLEAAVLRISVAIRQKGYCRCR